MPINMVTAVDGYLLTELHTYCSASRSMYKNNEFFIGIFSEIYTVLKFYEKLHL